MSIINQCKDISSYVVFFLHECYSVLKWPNVKPNIQPYLLEKITLCNKINYVDRLY